MSRIAVFGATGFVGATLVERLIRRDSYDVVPMIRSAGNAWRLSRYGIPLHSVDLVAGEGLDASLEGVDVVVNCTRGSKEVMIDGLDKLLKASRKHGIRRFVHLSSVMIYGDPPLAETEEAEPVRQSMETYGGIKLKQDEMVKAAARNGLSSTILVPPNIAGPYSDFLCGVLATLNTGRFALLEGGTAPINLVDVENLCHAVELAFSQGREDGSRYFINNDDSATWSDVISDLQELQMSGVEPLTIPKELLELHSKEAETDRGSIARSAKHLVSSHMREALRKDPLWNKFDRGIRNSIAKLGRRVEDRLRLSIEGPAPVRMRSALPDIDWRLSAQQLRVGRHSIDRARSELGFTPQIDYQQSMQNFKTWYRRLHGLDGEFADLLRELYV